MIVIYVTVYVVCREDSTKVMVLLTDGKSSNRKLTKQEAMAAK
jgi:hypothetical protein